MAVTAKQLSGSIAYLKGVSSQMTRTLLAAETLPTITPLRDGVRTELRTRRITVKPHTRRGIDREKLRSDYPEVYAAAVTITPPAQKYGIRLDVQPGLKRRKSAEWALIAEEAAESTRQLFDRAYRDADWSRVDVSARALYAVKAQLTSLRAEEEAARVLLAAYIEENELPTALRGLDDGLILAKLADSTVGTDYALIENSPAAWLVTHTPAAGYSFIDYAQPGADAEGDPEAD